MASVPNRPYPLASHSEVNTTNVTATTVSGANVVANSSSATRSGSALFVRGNIALKGFTTTGSISAGNILVLAGANDTVTTGSAIDQAIIGVAAGEASAGGSVDIYREGIATFIASGSINRGALVGVNPQGITRVQENTSGSCVIGIALNNASAEGTLRVLIQPQ